MSASLPVNVVDGEVQRLGLQLVLLGHLDQPVHEDLPHVRRDVRLLVHVVALRRQGNFPRSQEEEHVLQVQVEFFEIILKHCQRHNGPEG